MKTFFGLLLVPLLGLALQQALSTPNVVQAQAPVTVLVVRHAEAETSDPANPNPGLSKQGTERAQALDKLLSHAGVTHLYCSEYQRTHDTLTPLSKRLGLPLEVISAREPERQLQLIEALPPGSVAVIAGHSNTAPALVEQLGVQLSNVERHPQQAPQLAHDEYNRLFLITLPGTDQAKASLLELRYGR